MTVNESITKLYKKFSASDKIAFVSAFVCGLLVHMPAMLMDVPNHDGLSSMHFSQNMITSGRWFLAAVCAASSFYTVPWIIGLIGLFELAITAVLLKRIFEIENPVSIFLISALLTAFPSLASTFAYVFTLDGYMAGLMLAVLAVYLARNNHYILGGIALAFSLGTYQAYLPFAMLLSICLVWVNMASGEKNAIKKSLEFVYIVQDPDEFTLALEEGDVHLEGITDLYGINGTTKTSQAYTRGGIKCDGVPPRVKTMSPESGWTVKNDDIYLFDSISSESYINRIVLMLLIIKNKKDTQISYHISKP